MKFKSIITNLVELFDQKVLDAQSFKNAVLNSINQYHFIPILFKHQICGYGFEVENCKEGVVVSSYQGGKKIHTRIITDSDNEVRIYNYCNKFATDTSYRNMRMREAF